nr:type II secretion system protein [uncultured Niameybacter sp.]
MEDIKKGKGFTLVETIITMAIMSIVLLALGRILTTALNLQKRSNEITRINNRAASEIETRVGVTSDSTVTLTFPTSTGSISMVVTGSYYSGNESGATYRYFKPFKWIY